MAESVWGGALSVLEYMPTVGLPLSLVEMVVVSGLLSVAPRAIGLSLLRWDRGYYSRAIEDQFAHKMHQDAPDDA